MSKKKSNAQIKRLMKRAAERGEAYQGPELRSTTVATSASSSSSTCANSQKQPEDQSQSASSAETVKKLKIANNLAKEIERIALNKEINAKERRSLKRKAEAIATEQSGCETAEELLKWYDENKPAKKAEKETQAPSQSKKPNPYIVFVGQLSYETTQQSLFAHFQKELEEFSITEQDLQIRMLTDPKTKKSKGMAFIEVSTPDLLYATLRLHHTFLEGRRINIERSTGGRKNSATRQNKIREYRKEQEEFMHSAVDEMISQYVQSGDIQQGELDEAVISLCKKHSGHIVQAALERYVESNGRDMDNPSAYLNFLLGKLATEGIFTNREEATAESTKKQKKNHREISRSKDQK